MALQPQQSALHMGPQKQSCHCEAKHLMATCSTQHWWRWLRYSLWFWKFSNFCFNWRERPLNITLKRSVMRPAETHKAGDPRAVPRMCPVPKMCPVPRAQSCTLSRFQPQSITILSTEHKVGSVRLGREQGWGRIPSESWWCSGAFMSSAFLTEHKGIYTQRYRAN